MSDFDEILKILLNAHDDGMVTENLSDIATNIVNVIPKRSAEKKPGPTIVCLCGSTRFKDVFIRATKEETICGKIVLSVGMFGHLEGLNMEGETKRKLDELHLEKIRLADEVLILNVGDYVGKSTQRELEFALDQGKTIRFWEKRKNPPACAICGSPTVRAANGRQYRCIMCHETQGLE